jgi:drug/metabolite transporter (DMT)-like permease
MSDGSLAHALLRLRIRGKEALDPQLVQRDVASALIAWERGSWAMTQSFGSAQWIAAAFIGVVDGALAFYLWVHAIERTTPTRVANTMTVNPIAASLLAAVLVGEPLGLNLAVGIAAVALGIWLASSAPG